MSKTLTISDEAYSIIKQSAENNGRSLTKELDILLMQPVAQAQVMPVDISSVEDDEEEDDDEENKPWLIPKKDRVALRKEDLHSVVIPSVDTSQPRERITPHERWVPSTPEELEAELEKLHRGERTA